MRSGLTLASLIPFFSFALASAIARRQDSSTTNVTYPVSVERAANSTGFGFAHADNDEYTATIYVNGVAFQVCSMFWYLRSALIYLSF